MWLWTIAAASAAPWTQQVLSPPADPWSVAVLDLDGDGWNDVVALLPTLGRLVWYRGPLLLEGPALGGVPGDLLHPADLDGDGDLDLIVADDVLVWLENLGASALGTPLPLGGDRFDRVRKVLPGDLDGDGDVDLVVRDDIGLWRLENLGAAGFGAAAPIATVAPFLWQVADLDADGAPDLVINDNPEVRVVWGTGPGFGATTTACTHDGTWPAAADLDGDGDLDLVTGSGAELTWCEHQGGRSFAAPMALAALADDRVTDLQATDLDGDGDPDLVVKVYGDLVTVENTGGALGGPVGDPLPSFLGELHETVVGDVDGDGLPDLVSRGAAYGVFGGFSPAIVVHLNPSVPPPAPTGDTGGPPPSPTGDTGEAPPPADTAAPPPAGGSGTAGGDPPEEDDPGCGCATDGTPTWALAGLGVALAVRRRRS